MKIAIVSLDQVWEDKTANQLNCKNYIKQASKSGCDLIVFPEMTLTGFSMNTALIAEEPQQSPTVDFFTQQADYYKLAVAFGVVFVSVKMATNNMVVIDQTGSKLSSYVKIHPFSFSGENNYYSGGNQLGQCEIEGTTIGLTICYDLRFPEIFQALSKDCSIILNIANWPEKRIRHWNTLLEARAIETQSFIIGVNRTGTDGNNLNYAKSSSVFHPNGEKIEPSNSYLEMDIYDLNPLDVVSARKSFPMKLDRNTIFYKSIL